MVVVLSRWCHTHATKEWCTDGCAASGHGFGFLGPILAARGEIEAQGRGSLHPHILVWLLLLPLQEVLDRLRKDPATFHERLRCWMYHLVHAVLSVQQSSVLHIHRLQQGDATVNVPTVAPLPFGPNEQRNFRSDGFVESHRGGDNGREGW